MVELQNFSLFYGDRQILHEISAKFGALRITAVIGPSGCGKTTLLKAINRTAELHDGFRCRGGVLVGGEDIYSVRNVSAVRRKAGLVLQKPVAFPLSIRENVLFGPRYYGTGGKEDQEEIVCRTLSQAGLWEEVKDRLDAPADQLSGGQMQRLSIARILAVNPQILLLDEPCSSLDVKSTRMIEELLLGLKARLTIIVVTHNLSQARRIADDTVFLSQGKVIESGRTEQILNQPREQMTREYLAF